MADQSLHSPIKPHFFKPLLPGFRTHLDIPVAFFSKYVEGRNDQNKTAKLRSDASGITWLVKMDGLKLTDGWEDFASAHDLRTGDIVVFRHEGEMVFHVTALGPSCCEIQYTSSSSHNINDDDQTNTVSRNGSRVKKNPRKKVESSSNHSRFVANVTAWGLSNDRLNIPLPFGRSNGLNKMRGKKIYLHNEEGRSWKLSLEHDKTGIRTYVKSGWRRFCDANGISQGQKHTFKLVRRSAPPVIRLCRPKSRPKQRSESESPSDHSCFEGSVSPSSLSNDQLYLPRSFVSLHGLEKRCSVIILKNEQGSKWPLVLKHTKSINLTYLKKGWTSFCDFNGIKVGDSFKFKLSGTWEEPVLSLCPAEANRAKTPLKCSEGSDDINPEESEEDKNISQECLEIKKRKYRSRCRASVENMDDDQTNIGKSSRVKKNPRKKVESSSNHSRFVAKVSAWALRSDRQYIPITFARFNGLNKMRCKKIYLHNEEGRSWKLGLEHDKTGMHTYLRSGWRRFCSANGISQGQQHTFKLVRKSAPPVIRLYRSKPKPKQTSETESASDNSCFEGFVDPLSLSNDLQYLPRNFVISNGLDKRCSEIVLKNEEGIKWPLVLKHYKSATYLKKGWSSFCQVNRIKAGDSFKFKLVGTWKEPVLSLCPTESNREKNPSKCSGGSDDVKPEESEEESNEDKNISQHCLGIKKRKYQSRCKASVENMDDDQTNIVTGNSSRVKKSPRKTVESSSDHLSFVGNVTASSLRNDRLYLPLSFERSNGLDKMSGKKIVLLNEEGRSWKLNLSYNKAGMHTYVRSGWKSFCDANGMSQGQQYTFKLVRRTAPPVLRLYLAKHRPKPESSSQHSYFVGSVSASSLNKDKLYLWRSFVSSNGLDKGCNKMTLKNEWGREWTLVLKHYESIRFTIIKRGWTSFCQDNGLKARDSFKFKLVETGENPILSLCPADSNRDKTPLEYAKGIDNVKSLSSSPSSGDDSSRSKKSEDESIEDKNISQDCLEIKKRKYCLNCRASSSYTPNRFVTLTLTQSAFHNSKLFLPRGFTKVNGINKPRKITLLGQDGVKWVVDLYQEKKCGTMRFGKGWKQFCEAQGVKVGESFMLELIWEDEASPVLKFCTKVNSA